MVSQKKKSSRLIDGILHDIYYDISNPSSFSSPYVLWKAARLKNDEIKLHHVKDWMASQHTYTVHRRAVRKFRHRKLLVPRMNHQWQADLMEVIPIQKENKGYRYLLAVIDCFSRYAHVVPIKNKQASTTAEAFEEVIRVHGHKPKLLQTDHGKEFIGQAFQKMLKSHNIILFHTHQDVKAQIVERFNRTFKDKLFKYFTANNTLRYYDILEAAVDAYNRSPHTTLGGYSPAGVNKRNEKKIFEILYASYLKENPPDHRFQVGDRVRLSKYRKTFERGFTKNFTEEVFTIANQLDTNPPTYHIKDDKDELLSGALYENELVLVKK